jgi:hypothetical protein
VETEQRGTPAGLLRPSGFHPLGKTVLKIRSATSGIGVTDIGDFYAAPAA